MLKVLKRHLKIENTLISQVVPELWITEDCKIVLRKYICSVHTLFLCHTLMDLLHRSNPSQWPLPGHLSCPVEWDVLRYLSHRNRRLAEFTSCCAWISQIWDEIWDDMKMVKPYSCLCCSSVWDLSIHSPSCPFPHLQGVAKTLGSDTACGGQRRHLHLHTACCVIFAKTMMP